MPGEYGDEQESQNVGYHEKRYTPTGEWMKSTVESVPTEKEEENDRKQAQRILNNFRKNLFRKP